MTSRLCGKLILAETSPPGVFCKKGVLKSFARFTGNTFVEVYKHNGPRVLCPGER